MNLPSKLVNLLIVIVTLLVTGLSIEFIFLRVFALSSDLPTLEFSDGVIKYKAFQEGHYRVRDEIDARFRINANGWNSAVEHYEVSRDPARKRIAIIGDSYVESLQVNVDKNFGELLAAELGSAEVFRFGISGAPLSQYVHMLRNEVARYHPDIVIILLVHNDFDESYRFVTGVYTSSFLKFDVTPNGIREILPQGFVTPWYAPFRDTATWRYFVVRQQVNFVSLRNLFLATQPRYEANIRPAEVLEDSPTVRKVITYALHEIRKVLVDDTTLLILMDGDRSGIYAGKMPQDLPVLKLNELVRDEAAVLDIPFVDLHPIFEKAYRESHRKFNFEHDGHWNSYGHHVVAKAMQEALQAFK